MLAPEVDYTTCTVRDHTYYPSQSRAERRVTEAALTGRTLHAVKCGGCAGWRVEAA